METIYGEKANTLLQLSHLQTPIAILKSGKYSLNYHPLEFKPFGLFFCNPIHGDATSNSTVCNVTNNGL